MHHLDLSTLTLQAGNHDSPDEGHCVMETVALFAGEPFSDHPQCVDPTLTSFCIGWNDGMRSDGERDQLKPYIPALVGTRGTGSDAARRAWLALDWSVRVSAPAWLDLAGLADHAQRLRDVPELVDEVPADTKAALNAAGAAAGDAAMAAAWAAMAAAWAAGDAAMAAAWAAGDAARAAARDAARAAARAAARDAASAAARAAARAAWDAARAATGAALEPTVHTLQASAHDLLRRMIAAGHHNADAFAALPPVDSLVPQAAAS